MRLILSDLTVFQFLAAFIIIFLFSFSTGILHWGGPSVPRGMVAVILVGVDGLLELKFEFRVDRQKLCLWTEEF